MEPTQPILLCRYSYDPLDRLISQLQPDTPAQRRFYCKNRLTTEIQGAIARTIVQHENLLLAQQQLQTEVLDTILLATDLQRSVLNTIKENHQRQTITYSPYGHRTAESGLTNLLGFNGERSDPVTGHYLLGNGYRAFNTVLMRFNSPDSWSPFGEGGLNSYTYVTGDPINNADSTGHMKVFFSSPFKAISKNISYTRESKLLKKASRLGTHHNTLKYDLNRKLSPFQHELFIKDLNNAYPPSPREYPPTKKSNYSAKQKPTIRTTTRNKKQLRPYERS